MMRWTHSSGDPEGLVPFVQDPDAVVRRMRGSLLTLDPLTLAAVAQATVWSGTLAELEGEGGPFDAHPRTWGAAGWAALEAACERCVRAAETVFAVRPHARHVVSDIPGLRRFAASIAARHPGRFQLLLDPVSMLDISHIEQRSAEDTLRRIAEERSSLGSLEFPLAGLVIANIRREGDRLVAAPLEQGLIDPEFLWAVLLAD